MNKEMRDVLNQIENKKLEMKSSIENKDLEKAEEFKGQIENLKREYDLLKVAFEETSVDDIKNMKEAGDPVPTEKNKFFNKVRSRVVENFNPNQAMQSGDNTQGGYTVPQDIQTRINQFLEAEDSLQPFVRRSPVTMEAGSRVFQRRSASYITGFQQVDEMGRIPQEQTPQFETLGYKIRKYAGFFVTSNEVLADTDQALESVLINWIGNMSRVTRNRIILDVLDQKEKTPLTHADDIKTVINVTLDPAFRNRIVFFTNQDGLNFIDQLKYTDGRYMLQETIAFRTGHAILGRQLVVISNNDMPTVNGQIPFIIGDLHEAVELFDRQQTSILPTNTGGDSFLTDTVWYRAIERLDCVMRDEKAFVYGTIDINNREQWEQHRTGNTALIAPAKAGRGVKKEIQE